MLLYNSPVSGNCYKVRLFCSLLGLKLESDRLRIEPCLPPDWTGFTVHYRYRETVYHIVVHQMAGADGDEHLDLDGERRAGLVIPLVDDRREHRAELWVHASAPV